MKQNPIVKASLFTLILAFMAVGTIAIAKAVMTKPFHKLEPQTWYFTGEHSSDPTDPANYSTDPVEEKPCVTPYQTICRIQAPANPLNLNQPDMEAEVEDSEDEETVEDQISAAFSSLQTSSPKLNETVKAFRQE